MYNTSNAGFLAAACNPNRVIDTKAVLNMATAVTLSTNDIISYKVIYASVAGKSFTPGSFVASQFELSLNASSPTVSGVNFKTAVINNIALSAGIQVSGAMVYLPMGKFFLGKDGVKDGNGGKVAITATDIPPVLYTEFNSNTLSLPCTVQEALTQISTVTGLSLNISASSFPNLSVQLTETFSLVTTYREALMFIAEVLGGYVQMGRNGEICIKRCFSGLSELGAVLDENYLFSVNKQESTVKPFQHINLKSDKDDIGVSVDTGLTTGCVYDIVANPLTYGHPEDFLPGLVNPTAFTEFYPSTISFHGRPDIDTGDVLSYVYKGTAYILPVCNHTFEYNGGFKTTVESVGSDSLKSSSEDSGLKAQVTALRQNINTLVRDLEQTKSQITDINGNITDMSTLLQTASGLSAQVSKLEGDLEKLAGWELTADGLRVSIESAQKELKETQDQVNANQAKLLTYFDFLDDGLTIGMNSSNIKLRLANNKIQFLKDNTMEVAYFSEGQLYVTDAHFLRSLVLGNFEFEPRDNGNLSLKRRR